MEKRKQLPGKFVWFEHESHDKKRAQAFYAELFGWKMQPFPMGSYSYDMIYAGDTMIGGWADLKAKGAPARWMACVSVEDVDAAAKAAAANGGRVVDAPMPIPNVGRIARIADPQGAEILLFKSDNGDPEDGCADQGRWAWNELHTTDAKAALAFYEAASRRTFRPARRRTGSRMSSSMTPTRSRDARACSAPTSRCRPRTSRRSGASPCCVIRPGQRWP